MGRDHRQESLRSLFMGLGFLGKDLQVTELSVFKVYRV